MTEVSTKEEPSFSTSGASLFSAVAVGTSSGWENQKPQLLGTWTFWEAFASLRFSRFLLEEAMLHTQKAEVVQVRTHEFLHTP